MARLRQQYPQNYVSSSYINTEFENLIRYLNAAELGNQTIAELLGQLFDDEGNFAGPIEFRLDPDEGLQYRIGEHTNTEEGWVTISAIDDLRGPPGANVGIIDGPLFYNREDTTANGTPTVVNYSLMDGNTDDIVVYVNGLLIPTSDYTFNFGTGDITFTAALVNNDTLTVYAIRVQTVPTFQRQDSLAVAPQAQFAFVHGPNDRLLVYKNGLIQREGASYDYTHDDVADTVTFIAALDPGDTATIMNVENSALTDVGGLMLEDEYTDDNGFITYNKLAIADNEIPQAKVASLSSNLSSKAKMTVANLTPVAAVSGDLWLNTGPTPNVMSFYDGVQFISMNPANTIPSFLISNANQYLRVNGTGTALEYGDVDFSTLVPKTYMGAANGVATLDSSGKMPTNQLPQVFSQSTIPFLSSWETSLSTTANGTYFVTHVFKQILRVDGIIFQLTAGTCDVRISVDGVPLGATYAVTTSLNQATLGSSIQIDGSIIPKRVEIAVTNQAAAGILTIGLAAASVTA